MKQLLTFAICLAAAACSTSARLLSPDITSALPSRKAEAPSGSVFAASAAGLSPDQREEAILREILAGNFPDFMRRPVRIDVETDGIEVSCFVMPDYLCIGSDSDFVRVPMRPSTAQKIADAFGCFLSTDKICDDIYAAAKVRLEPQPLTERREEWTTMVEHNAIIERQRAGAEGLIAGIKKDVILTERIAADPRPDRLALYGWHRLDGKPIQPIYTGHINRYVDYSHGIRLVFRTLLVNGRPVDYTDVMKDRKLRRAISRDTGDPMLAYPTETVSE